MCTSYVLTYLLTHFLPWEIEFAAERAQPQLRRPTTGKLAKKSEAREYQMDVLCCLASTRQRLFGKAFTAADIHQIHHEFA